MLHYKSQHNNQLPANIDANQRYANYFVDMPTKANYSMIAGLKQKVEEQKGLLEFFQKR